MCYNLYIIYLRLRNNVNVVWLNIKLYNIILIKYQEKNK